MRAVVPWADLPVPDGVAVIAYDGQTPPEVPLDDVEVYVLPLTFSPQPFELLPRMPRLRVLQTLTAGHEHVLPHLPDGVTLCGGAGVHDTSTAELAMTLILASLRGVDDFARAQAEHRWAYALRPSLADRSVVIIGAGGIGGALARRLEPFECTVQLVARTARDGVRAADDLPALLPTADIVVLTVPLTEQTRGMVDAGFLARLQPGALLVNVARGAVVDTDALCEALAERRIRAALDVTDPEPLPPDHPLWEQPGVLITPHVGGSSSAFAPRGRALAADQLARLIRGDALRNVIVAGDPGVSTKPVIDS